VIDGPVDYTIRTWCPDDEQFLYRTWLDSLRLTGSMYRSVRDRVFFAYYRRVITGLLDRGAQVLVAAEADSPVIFGCLVAEPLVNVDDRQGVLHWVYVKSNWRRLGIATRLIEASGIDPNKAYYTHRTSYAVGLPGKRIAQRDGRSGWREIREAKMKLAEELEAQGKNEGDVRVLLVKWPGAVFNPFLLFHHNNGYTG
jgi:GNAT superfamily N-acetyltransferase